MQMSLFDGKLNYNINKPIRLIELFAGYGSQHLALRYLNVNIESYRISEWAIKSIQAYKDLHYPDDNTDYSQEYDFEHIMDFLFWKGISSDYCSPMSNEQIKRLGEPKCRQIFNNIIATKNLVNIQNVHASDFDFANKDYTYLLTYSFPCQDLSKAGLGKGMEKGNNTRSGMLWEVERILDECGRNLPQILLMENVPDLIGTNNIKHFASWLSKLESLGYKCYWKILNAKDYGIPQNRERCFMVSILGDYMYAFPEKQKLEKRLIDVLEENVDEKYYLKGKTFDKISGAIIEKNIPSRTGIVLCDKVSQTREIANTIKARYDCGYEHYTPGPTGIIELTKNQSQGNRVFSANGGGLGAKTGLYQIPRGKNKGGMISSQTCPTITTSCFQDNTMLVKDYRIRKLTPKECFRLMGVKDEDFEKIAKNQSNASLYHLAGDSIVVNVLMALFKNIVGGNYGKSRR